MKTKTPEPRTLKTKPPEARTLSEEVLSSIETAGLTKVAEGTLRYWRSTGQGPAWFRLGPRRIAYLRGDVESWMRSQYDRSYTDPAAS